MALEKLSESCDQIPLVLDSYSAQFPRKVFQQLQREALTGSTLVVVGLENNVFLKDGRRVRGATPDSIMPRTGSSPFSRSSDRERSCLSSI